MMDRLTLFGLFAVSAILLCYALEDRSHWYVLGFALFGLVEAIWAVVALRRWRFRRQ